MTNINITIPEEVHKDLKVQAAMEAKPLKQLIIERLETHVKGGNKKWNEHLSYSQSSP